MLLGYELNRCDLLRPHKGNISTPWMADLER